MLKAARAESQPPRLEKVIEAFVLPALSVVQPQAGGASFSRLCVVLAAENSKLLDRLAKNFNASDFALIDALCECLQCFLAPPAQVMGRCIKHKIRNVGDR